MTISAIKTLFKLKLPAANTQHPSKLSSLSSAGSTRGIHGDVEEKQRRDCGWKPGNREQRSELNVGKLDVEAPVREKQGAQQRGDEPVSVIHRTTHSHFLLLFLFLLFLPLLRLAPPREREQKQYG
jgi:hypothetical protein